MQPAAPAERCANTGPTPSGGYPALGRTIVPRLRAPSAPRAGGDFVLLRPLERGSRSQI